MRSLMLAILATVALFFVAANHAPVMAQGDPECRAGGGLVDTEYCKQQRGTANPIIGDEGVLTKATKILTTMVSIGSVIVIIVAGLMLALSRGDSSNYNRARNAIVYALAGLVISMFARWIVIWLLKQF